MDQWSEANQSLPPKKGRSRIDFATGKGLLKPKQDKEHNSDSMQISFSQPSRKRPSPDTNLSPERQHSTGLTSQLANLSTAPENISQYSNKIAGSQLAKTRRIDEPTTGDLSSRFKQLNSTDSHNNPHSETQSSANLSEDIKETHLKSKLEIIFEDLEHLKNTETKDVTYKDHLKDNFSAIKRQKSSVIELIQDIIQCTENIKKNANILKKREKYFNKIDDIIFNLRSNDLDFQIDALASTTNGFFVNILDDIIIPEELGPLKNQFHKEWFNNDEEYQMQLERWKQLGNNDDDITDLTNEYTDDNFKYEKYIWDKYKEIISQNSDSYIYEADQDLKKTYEAYRKTFEEFLQLKEESIKLNEEIHMYTTDQHHLIDKTKKCNKLCSEYLDRIKKRIQHGFSLLELNDDPQIEETKDYQHRLEKYNKELETLTHTYKTIASSLEFVQLEAEEGLTTHTGTLIKGKYALVYPPIGKGGFGTVYRARDLTQMYKDQVYRDLAIKVVDTKESNSEKTRQAEHMLKREALLLTELNHESIPSIHEFITEKNRSCLVMNLIDGITLQKTLTKAAEKKLSLDEVIGIGTQLCSVLEYLHKQGIIFRDLKPSNIMYTSNRHIYLVDFGLANYFDPNEPHGSLAYAPPEQLSGDTSVLSDIYSLGVILHQLLSGQTPNEGPFSKLPPLNLSGSSGKKISTLIEQMVELNKLDRPSSIREIHERLLDLIPRTHQAEESIQTEQIARNFTEATSNLFSEDPIHSQNTASLSQNLESQSLSIDEFTSNPD